MRPSSPRRFTSLILLAGGLALCAAVAGCREDGAGVEVKSLKFRGLKAVTESQLKSVLATTQSDRLPWGEKFFFDRGQFEADLKRTTAFYRDRGYPDARVKSFDVRLSEDQNSVRITIEVEEGEPIRVERIVMNGFDPIPEDQRRRLQEKLPLQPGQPLDSALIQASREVALDQFREHGYPRPKVDVMEAPGSSERLRVVTYTAEPGRIAYVGPIEINGVMSVNDRIVRRQLTFRSGELFQQSKLRESQRKLYSLELFNFVNVEGLAGAADTAVQGTDADRIPTRVTVTEGKHRKMNFGVGYGTEEKARGEIDWRHVNFFGGARTAGVFARYSALDRGVRLNFKQPYVFNPRYWFTMTGQSWFSDEPAYELTTIGGRATLTRDFGGFRGRILGSPRTTTLALTYANEWEDYTISEEARNDPTFRDELIALGLDPETGSDRGQLSALMLDGVRNTTGSLLDARNGYLINLHLEQAGGWLGGDFEYREISGEGRFYQAIGERTVVAVRARAGSIDSTGPEEELVPFFKRYFLGGATNLRGWGRYEVSPLTDEGNPIGGTSFFNFSTELRLKLVGKLGGVLFLDGGNVWPNPGDFDFNSLRYDVGPGLRYTTPIGPVRFDVGFQINPIPGLLVNGEEQKRPFRVHFSIGQAF
jgi:outer membrane protein assembly complex protein YaeT